MGRHKTAKNVSILPWLSGRSDCKEGRFIQIGNSLLLSRRTEDGDEGNLFLNLSPGARLTYLCMAMEAGGKKEFKFPNAAIKKYGLPVRSARRWIEELEQNGFIICNHALYTREANVYVFTATWKTAMPG